MQQGVRTTDPARPISSSFGSRALATIANVANALTIARLIISIPLLYWMYRVESGWAIWAVFFAISMSDLVDGIVARRIGPTAFGAFFDPLADKVLAIGGFTVLALRGYYAWIPVVIMAFREIGVSLARSILAKHDISLPARKLGKMKTFAQLCAVGFPLFPPISQYHTFHNIVLWVACVLSVVSGIDLFVNAQRKVHDKIVQ